VATPVPTATPVWIVFVTVCRYRARKPDAKAVTKMGMEVPISPCPRKLETKLDLSVGDSVIGMGVPLPAPAVPASFVLITMVGVQVDNPTPKPLDQSGVLYPIKVTPAKLGTMMETVWTTVTGIF